MLTKEETKFKDTEIGLIPEEWEKKSIGEIANEITDYIANGSFALLKENVTYYNKKDFARLVRLVDYNNDFCEDNAVYINAHSYNFLKKTRLFPRDIVLSNVGEYSGTVFRIPDLGLPMSLGPNSILTRFGESDDFMFYFLKSKIGQYLIGTIKSGSANPKFNKTDFKKIALYLPPLCEQEKIAEILSSLDKKIELNRRMNKTLEEMGKTLFKRWFVDFEFPNEDGKPYKSSGGKMVDSELGEIPEGWEVASLRDHVEIIQGFSFKGKDFTDSGSPLVRMGNFTQSYNLSFTKDNTKYFNGACDPKFHLKPGDLVICLSDVTQQGLILGNPGFIPNDGRQYLLNQRVAKIVSKNISPEFLFCVFADIKFKRWVVDTANSTTVLNTSSGSINEFKFLNPKTMIVQNFKVIFEDILCQIANGLTENTNLVELRENLLPKLISGKISTKEVLH